MILHRAHFTTVQYFFCNQRSSRYRLRSSQSNQLVVPPVKLSTYGSRSFAVAGPTTWNSLPDHLRDPELSIDSVRRQLKTPVCSVLKTTP